MIIKTKNLGLAAYIKMSGDELLKLEGKWFFFETNSNEREWHIKYLNSCCYNHDKVLCELRNIINGERR